MKGRSKAQRRRRVQRVFLRALRTGFPHLARFTPSLSARLAERMFCTPPKYARLRREERALGEATFSVTRLNDGTFLPTWKWGQGPLVLLVHGWGGHSGRLTPFVRPLLRAGFSVIAFDAPGHGDAPGRYSALPDFVHGVREIAKKHGPLQAVIGHSLGAAAAALAVRGGVLASRLVLLAPPAEAEKYTGRFARFFGIPSSTHDAMKRRLEERYRIRWVDLVVAGGDCPAKVLVFHDHRDGRVPFRDGEEIARTWPNAELVRTRGLGHHRILGDPRVISRAVAFIAKEPDPGIALTESRPRRSELSRHRLQRAFAS
jgi:pimeloyl-ACP methyl ester carboxylesterase